MTGALSQESEEISGCCLSRQPRLLKMSRRVVVYGPLLVAGSKAGIAYAAQAAETPKDLQPQPGDLLVLSDSDSGNAPLRPADIPLAGDPTLAWGFDPKLKIARDGDRLLQVLLMRFDPASLSEREKKWAVEGVVAFSAICTHQGCTVTYWLKTPQVLECPCHQSRYNPRDGAKVVAGPAPRPLPVLPLKMDGGLLVVAASFTDRVGGEQQR